MLLEKEDTPNIWLFHADKKLSEVKNTWTVVWVIFLCLSIASIGVYVVYKHRLRVSHWHIFTC